MAVTIAGNSNLVYQVVSFATNSSTATASGTYVSTPITVSITPKFSTSKILVLVTTSSQMNSGNQPQLTIYRNSTNIGGGSISSFYYGYNGNAGAVWTPVNISYLDSPATTSSTAYTVYIQSASGTITIGNASSSSTITLMEIAG